jgi:hypothetical protein
MDHINGQQPRTPSTHGPAPADDGVESLIRALRAAVNTSPHLREAVRQLGLWLIDLAGCAPAESPRPADPPAAAPAPADVSAPAAPAAPIYVPRPIRGPTEVVISPEAAAAALKRGLGAEAVSPRRPDAPLAAVTGDGAPALPVPRIDFALIQQRCKLKVSACDFARRHDDHLAAGGSFEQLRPEYDALITRGKALPDCFLWMINPRSLLRDAGQLAQIRACYANLADAAAMMLELTDSHGEGHWPEEALWLLAEAQSALYVALANTPYRNPDPDQLQTYGFVRDEARRRRLFMDQFLSEDAPADPADAPDLAAHIAAFRADCLAQRKVTKARREALRKVEYEVRQLLSCLPDDRPDHARKVEAGVRGFIESGGVIDAPALADAVAPARDLLRELLPPDSEVWAIRAPAPPASDHDDRPDDDDEGRAPIVGSELLKARQLLAGRTVLLIGGEERPQHARRLEQALDLRELRWVGHREHSSLAPLEHEIARPEVDLVLLPIRWNGTETGPTIRQWCKHYHKPCVTLKAGYSANQIAHAVLEQVSERLASA